jgi:hypothetical protein
VSGGGVVAPCGADLLVVEVFAVAGCSSLKNRDLPAFPTESRKQKKNAQALS